MRQTELNKDGIGRRALLIGSGGLGIAALVGARVLRDGQGAVRAQAGAPATPGAGTATAATASPAAWTPPPIPQPLPTVGGVAPTVVGAAPPAPSAQMENPAGGGTPTMGGSQAPVQNPGAPPQPVAIPVAPADGTPEPAVTVTLTADFRFDPAEVTITVGQAVRWVNAGRSPETVTGAPALAGDKRHAVLPPRAQPWDSGVLNAGDQYVHVFDVPGDYGYFSIPQEAAGMVGRVVVQK